MTDIRARQGARHRECCPPQDVCLGRGRRQARRRRLGLDLRPDPPGGPPRARATGMDVSHIHIRHIWPLPTNLGDLAKGLRPDHRARNEHRPAEDGAARPVSGRCPPLNKVSGQPFKIAEIEAAIDEALGVSRHGPEAATPVPAADHADRGGRGDRLFHRQELNSLMTEIGQAHRQGLRDRPGGALVPRLRRLCGAEGGAADDAGARRRAREDRVRHRHRLLVALPLLYGDLRLPHDPRPRAGGGDGGEAGQSRARRVDHHRRRRCAVDRRQSHDAHAAPQPRLPDPAVQQRDLRPDQGAIFADVAASARARPSTPFGSVDRPVRPCAFALGSGAPLRRARDRRAQESARRAEGRACP